MIRRPPKSTRTDTLFPYTTLFLSVNALLRGWSTNSQPLPSGLPTDLRDFIEHARQLPPWADQAKLKAAVDFNKKRGTYLGVAYGFRSEEHTSELQSLMRISYAVFCLKQKIKP